MRTLATGTLAIAIALSLAACQPSGQEVAELRKQNEEILAKLVEIEKGQAQILAAKPAAPPGRPQEDFTKVYDIPTAGAPIRGKADAPVTLIEYSDFQCPFCSRAQPLIEALLKKYPDDLRVVYKHFPLSFHKAARPVAVASMAANAQGRFWEFHDVVFKNTQSLDPAKVNDYAKEAGLDVEKFSKDLETNKVAYEKQVTLDMQQGQAASVRGTPTLYINGRKVQNRSIPGMSAMVDAALKAKADTAKN